MNRRKKPYFVKAVWDNEAKVFYSESDIPGLHIETKTIKQFETVLFDVAPELITENCISKADILNKPLKDLIPSFSFIVPEKNQAHA